jgi:hypothetical protein
MDSPANDEPATKRSAIRRITYAVSAIALVMVVGTYGFHAIEGMDYINAFYFESMLATGQGPPLQLQTSAGKVFASIMAFVSVGSVITTLIFTLGPMAATAWRQGIERVEKEVRNAGKGDATKGKKRKKTGSKK